MGTKKTGDQNLLTLTVLLAPPCRQRLDFENRTQQAIQGHLYYACIHLSFHSWERHKILKLSKTNTLVQKKCNQNLAEYFWLLDLRHSQLINQIMTILGNPHCWHQKADTPPQKKKTLLQKDYFKFWYTTYNAWKLQVSLVI